MIDDDVILGDVRIKMTRSTVAIGRVTAILTSNKRAIMNIISEKIDKLIENSVMSMTVSSVKMKTHKYDDGSTNYIELTSNSSDNFGNIPLVAGYIAGLQYDDLV